MKRRRKSKLKFEESSDQSPTTTADFNFSLTKIAVSQICRSVGYIATDSSALNTLTQTTVKFLQSLAGLATSFSNTANRTEVNLFDIVNSLQDIALSTSDCFPGGSTVHDIESHCLIKSAVLRNLSDFVTYTPEIPFAKPFPRRERDESDLDHATVTRSVEVKYVPAWLPPFPDANLYSERCTKDRSDHLWENSDSVTDREILPESLKSEICRGRSSGRLPQRRARVRFKMERDCSRGGVTRIERWRDNNDGESGRDVEVKEKIREEYIHSAGEWPI